MELKTYEDIEKYLENETKGKKDEKDKKSFMYLENLGVIGRATRLLRSNIEENMTEKEQEFIKEIGVSPNIYIEMKKKILKDNLSDKGICTFFNFEGHLMKIMGKYEVESKVSEKLIDYLFSFK